MAQKGSIPGKSPKRQTAIVPHIMRVRARPIRPQRQLSPTEKRTHQFFNLQTAEQALISLVQMHARGLRIKPYTGYSEDYNQPQIGEYATPYRQRVKFNQSRFVRINDFPLLIAKWKREAELARIMEIISRMAFGNRRINKRRYKQLVVQHTALKEKPLKPIEMDLLKAEIDRAAHDVAYVILSINTPYTIEKRVERGLDSHMVNYRDPIPRNPIDIKSFAMAYAKKAEIKNAKEFAVTVESWYTRLNYMNWDHAADHI